MPPALDKLYLELTTQLKEIEENEKSVLDLAKKSMAAVKQVIDSLRLYTIGNAFQHQEEEIHFFKKIKPAFCCHLIYYLKIYRFELGCPVGSAKERENYLAKVLAGINDYFENNLSFYEYYRSGATYLDSQYFLRINHDLEINLNSFSTYADPYFCTSHDYKISKILANEMLSNYFNAEQEKLRNKSSRLSTPVANASAITWTATKAGLIEIIYALYSDGSINNGNVDIKEIAEYVEQAFNIDLGNYYRVFQEIRIRKKGRTHYLDRLREKLIQRMDDTDENPR
ncbi:MAG TPA: RteC domain-containing protein [Puia sp.]|nr:RteC domain-containing protein [Puia sp.]